jgi:hypothetical protein
MLNCLISRPFRCKPQHVGYVHNLIRGKVHSSLTIIRTPFFPFGATFPELQMSSLSFRVARIVLSVTCADFEISGIYSQRNVACISTGLKKRTVGFNGDLVLGRSVGLPSLSIRMFLGMIAPVTNSYGSVCTRG